MGEPIMCEYFSPKKAAVYTSLITGELLPMEGLKGLGIQIVDDLNKINLLEDRLQETVRRTKENYHSKP